MNLLLDSSFETGTGWSFQPGASITYDFPPRTGDSCCYLLYQPAVFPGLPIFGQVIQSITVQPGELIFISIWARRASGACGLGLYVDGNLIDSIADDEAAEDWTLLSGFYECPSSSVVIMIKATAGLVAGAFLVDDAEALEPMADRNSYQMFKALFDRLKTINGTTGGYWHDLGGKVYPRWIHPDQEGAPDEPYLCVFMDDRSAYGEITGESLGLPIQPEIVVFLAPTDSTEIDTSQTADALKWHDDILRCLMPTDRRSWDLGSYAVQDVTPIEKRIAGDPPDGIPPFVLMRVSLTSTVTRAELGSGA